MGSATSPNDHVTSVRLTKDEHAALKRIAAADRRSFSNEIRHLIELRAAELDAAEELRDAA
jgi:predicted DNA-binding ribbon-helix-helix protein